MKTCRKSNVEFSDRATITQELNEHYLGITGYGIYAYFNPVEIDQFFNRYLNEGIPMRSFVRQCIVQNRKTSYVSPTKRMRDNNKASPTSALD